MPKISSLFNLQGLRLQREGHTRSMPNQTSSPRRYSMLPGRGTIELKIIVKVSFRSLFRFDLGLLTSHENSNHGRENY